ncbi:MAG: RNA methyltransferase [Actinomycetota bacterium]|nr:RNA methyltransferase [Actinomycetota bacterium]
MLAARKLLRRAHRDAAQAYLLEGTVPVQEALAARAAVRSLFVADDHPDAETLAAAAADAQVDVVRATRGVLESLSDTTTPQGVVAVVEMSDLAPADVDSDVRLVLVLDQIRDPGNAGTLVRCAAAAGAGAVFFTKGSVDPYAMKAARAAAGALFRVGLARDVELAAALEELRRRGFLVVGTDAGATTPYDAVDYTGKVAFVVGNEAWGISEEDRSLLDEVVGIPMPGEAESLNAAIAGALLLFEAVRQRRISSAAI